MYCVRDARATATWYQALGFSLADTYEEDGVLMFARLQYGACRFGLSPGRSVSAHVSLWVMTPAVEEMYALARASGALGGKICGAGGGGFLLVYCPPDRQERLAKGMHGYRMLPFALERDGSKVIFNYRREVWK